MAVTTQQLLDAAQESLLRIYQTDTSSWSESARQQSQFDIEKLQKNIDKYKSEIAGESGRRIFGPVRRVDY